jgi:hypothetical protein
VEVAERPTFHVLPETLRIGLQKGVMMQISVAVMLEDRRQLLGHWRDERVAHRDAQGRLVPGQ